MSNDILMFNKRDGTAWGVFLIGHRPPEEVIENFNQKLVSKGYSKVSVEYITHAYAVRVNGVIGQQYNTFIVDETVQEAKPITWVDGDLLDLIKMAAI